MNHLNSEAEPVGQGRLDDRVLDALQRMHGRMAFSGLRRSLGAHPESLARSLRRLEREGLIERASTGYRALNAPRAIVTSPEAELRSVAQIEVPLGLEPEGILARLTGRWFGGLRWVGVVERPPDRLLSWARRDGTGRVLLGAQAGSLHIYTALGRGEGDPNDSEDAAYDLLVAVADTLRPSGVARPVAFLAAADSEGGDGAPRAHIPLGFPADN
ncbi:MAG: Lrp/AsnC family transcriptional regulator [Thermoplasmata archaeon]|nr:Lrp/AsnC family transcriptional regulator [Thermoplasmata archaeon]